jgi:hypothetical protein
MPGLLAQVPTEQMLAPRATPEPVPDTLLPRLAGVIRKQQRRRRVWTGVAGAAAACLVTGLVLVTSPWSSPTSQQPQGTALTMTADTTVPVSATVRLRKVAWGTGISLECSYKDDESLPAGGARTYTLVAVPRDGGPVQQLAQWTALPGKTVTIPGSTNLDTAQIQDIQMLNSKGVTVLHVTPTV